MQEPRTSLSAGQRVLVRDEPWIVLRAERFDEVQVVHLRGTGPINLGREQSFLSPFDVVERTAASTRLRCVSRMRVLEAVAGAAAAAAWAEPWTASTAQIEYLPWQFEPAMAAVTGATRILLADAVGLGKTIQAILIVSELVARGLAERVLVLTPPSLRGQWQTEMRERFAISAAIFDQSSLNAMSASLPAGVNPWGSVPIAIASLDLVKRPEVRAAIDGAVFDILIVDEAHHVTAGTDRAAVVADLAARTPWVVLATATPHSGDEAEYAFLTSLGNGGEAIHVFNRSAARSGSRKRRVRMCAVLPTPEERTLLAAIADYARALRRRRRDAGSATLLAAVMARRAASSAAAVERTLRRRLALLSGEKPPEQQVLLPWDEGESADETAGDDLLSSAGLADAASEIRWLERLATLAALAAAAPSKVAVIRRLLRATSEQVLVFSEYRDVVETVVAGLRGTATAAVLHGGMPGRERRETIAAFNRGDIRVLVATDAAGEGLNLHHRCRLVINVELPWMPRRLEQRIGRVDRLGQTRRVHALHLVHRESFESTVIARLERRRAALQAGAAHASLATASAAPVVTRHRPLQPRRAPVRGALFTARRVHRSRAVALLFDACLLDSSERFVSRLAAAVRLELRGEVTAERVMTRRALRALLADPRLTEVVHRELARQCECCRTDMAATAARVVARVDACLRVVARRTNISWQGSLFDRRAENEARANADTASLLRHHLDRTRQTALALTGPAVTAPVLVAAWPAD